MQAKDLLILQRFNETLNEAIKMKDDPEFRASIPAANLAEIDANLRVAATESKRAEILANNPDARIGAIHGLGDKLSLDPTMCRELGITSDFYNDIVVTLKKHFPTSTTDASTALLGAYIILIATKAKSGESFTHILEITSHYLQNQSKSMRVTTIS